MCTILQQAKLSQIIKGRKAFLPLITVFRENGF